MGLSILVPGSSSGPGWATSLEADKLTIDAHTHVSGQGLQVPTAGININATLPFNTYGASSVGTVGLASQSTTASGTANIFYQSSGNVYWNNASGVPIQLTTGNAINVASVGGITGLGGTTGAFTYSDALKTFIATADTAKSAAIDAGAYTVRETNVANAKGVTLKSPTSLAADYNLTMPTVLPAASGLMLIDTSGNLAASATMMPAFVGIPSAASAVQTPPAAVSGGKTFYLDSTTKQWSSKAADATSLPIGPVRNSAAMASFTTTEKIVAGGVIAGNNSPVASFKIPANRLIAGSLIRYTVQGTCNSSNAGDSVSIIARVGTAGTIADTAIYNASLTGTTGSGAAAIPFTLIVNLAVTAVGSGAVLGFLNYTLMNNTTGGLINILATTQQFTSGTTFDSTIANFFSLGMVASAATCAITVNQASAEVF